MCVPRAQRWLLRPRAAAAGGRTQPGRHLHGGGLRVHAPWRAHPHARDLAVGRQGHARLGAAARAAADAHVRVRALSSIPATLRKLFPQLGPALTRRDEWAATFEHVLGPTLRPDTPSKLPDVPPPPKGELERQLALPIDEHAAGLIRTLCALAPPPDGAMDSALPSAECGAHIRTYREFAPWVRDRWAAWLAA